jgi:hypothetical protein
MRERIANEICCNRWGETPGEPQSNNVPVLEVQTVHQRKIKALEHHGLIRVPSDPDKGSTFSLSLPAFAAL